MKYKISKGLISQKLDGKMTIFDGEESALYTFNETASFIFKKIKSGWDKDKIIEALLKKYSVKKEKIDKDYEELIKELIKKKIAVEKKSA